MKTKYKILSIQDRLQKAIELELSTIPPYLTAYFSIKLNTNKMASEIIRSVVMEEMLHMALAGNLLISIGGKVALSEKNTPQYPLRMRFDDMEFKNREFDINLSSFSKDSLKTFLDIELPEYMGNEELERFSLIPAYTIGEFYYDILKDLKDVAEEIGENKLFVGDIKNQLTEQHYWHGGGQIIMVNNIASAQKAIELIVEQGEGSSVSKLDLDNLPHYFKFNELFNEKKYAQSDTSNMPPSGEPIQIDYTQVYNTKPNCKALDFRHQTNLKNLNDMFNQNYTSMLKQIEEGFNGNPIVFYTAIMNSMHQLTEIARSMMQIKIDNDFQGRTGSPSFEWFNTEF